jgi:hypothetical protein
MQINCNLLTPYKMHTLFSITRDDKVPHQYMLINNNYDNKNGNNGTGH